MSTTPTLTKAQLFHSHLVNCGRCHKAIKGNPSVAACLKIRGLLCLIGKKLLNETLQEETPHKKMMSFPFVAKLYENVMANIKGKWEQGKVIDTSRSETNRVMGYEIEITRERPYGMSPTLDHYYVNADNVRKLGAAQKTRNIQRTAGEYTIIIGGI